VVSTQSTTRYRFSIFFFFFFFCGIFTRLIIKGYSKVHVFVVESFNGFVGAEVVLELGNGNDVEEVEEGLHVVSGELVVYFLDLIPLALEKASESTFRVSVDKNILSEFEALLNISNQEGEGVFLGVMGDHNVDRLAISGVVKSENVSEVVPGIVRRVLSDGHVVEEVLLVFSWDREGSG
jgi:hypothetical protein